MRSMRMLIWSLQCCYPVSQHGCYCTEKKKFLVFTTITFYGSSYLNLRSKPDTHNCQGSPSVSIFCLEFASVPNPLSRQIRYRTMASDQIDTGAPVLSSQGPPDADPNPPGQDRNIESALRQINTNMGTMTQLLTDVCARLSHDRGTPSG